MKIKNLIPIIVLIMSVNNISAQTSLYLQFSEIEGIKSYYIADVDKLTGCTGCGISGYMGDNLKQLLTPEIDLKRIKTVTILMSNNNEAMAKLRTEAIKTAESGDYELLVVYKDSKEKSSVYKKKQGNCEIIIISDKTDEFILKQLLGDFSLKK
ncbi:MAG: DUF4252 domain-containing protein [Prevotellaceae bacterium]|jgi:hypothetical protein|nr:DUF4252 domain-containing protein [Prevotellaceae bacterium]